MIKLNFGCGHRFAKGWINIDFHSDYPEVQTVNLLKRFPFPDSYFDAVYSSHTLEHFTPSVAGAILTECRRVMKPGAIIRTVVPDLENTCREYLRILSQVDGSETARRQYEWVILELLDQLTRTEPTGLIGHFYEELSARNDKEMIAYVKSRTDTNPWMPGAGESFGSKFKKLSAAKVKNKLLYMYLSGVKMLIPAGLRAALVDNSRIGEKHRWMYDRYGMGLLMNRTGYTQISFPNAQVSKIPGFNADLLDINADGSPYKPPSLYCEAIKP